MVVKRRHLLEGSGPIVRDARDGTPSRMVYKKVVITYSDGSTATTRYCFLVAWDDTRHKWVKQD